MKSIKASVLKAACEVQARLVINDGKYEQWQEIMLNKLRAATGINWKDEGWKEDTSAVKTGGKPYHTLIFSHGKVSLQFGFVGTGAYEFRTATVVLPQKVRVKGYGTAALGDAWTFAHDKSVYNPHRTSRQVNSGNEIVENAVRILKDVGVTE